MSALRPIDLLSWMSILLLEAAVFWSAHVPKAGAQLQDLFTTSPDPTRDKVEACRLQELASPINLSDSSCGKQWVIFNVAIVKEFWEVNEVEFFWDSTCQTKLPAYLGVASQQMNSPDYAENKPRKAVDGDINTWFSSNCREILGGCKPYTAFVGLDIGFNDPKATEGDKYAMVKCVHIYQSPIVSRQALKVSLAFSVNRSWRSERYPQEGDLKPNLPWAFNETATYDAIGGGDWYWRPLRRQQTWRLWNLAPTPKPWEVAEIVFYTDLFCTQKAYGAVIVSGSLVPPDCKTQGTDCNAYSGRKAFDGVTSPGFFLPEPLPTRWIAGCSFFDGCASREAWIGIDFGMSPISVKCLQIFQPAEDKTAQAQSWTGSPTFASSVALETWEDGKWIEMQQYNGFVPGYWNNTMVEPYGAWRLANYDPIKLEWYVYELEFYEDPSCGVVGDPIGRSLGHPGVRRVIGVAIDGNPSLQVVAQDIACMQTIGKCATLAADGDTTTAWMSECQNCKQRQAWLGIKVPKATDSISCFRLFQSGDLYHRSDAVELGVWTGQEWVVQRLETGIGAGSWNFRPSIPWSMWRLVSILATSLPWTIDGLIFYEDPNCNFEIRPMITAEPIACGNADDIWGSPNEAFQNVPVGLLSTQSKRSWTTSCTPASFGSPGCAPSAAWIGLQAYSGTMDVKCVRLSQSRIRGRQASMAALQYWDGSKWLMATTMPVFPELGGGAWQSLPGVRGSMWRFSAEKAPNAIGVAVAELKLFSDPTCAKESIMQYHRPNVVPITSGAASALEVNAVAKYEAILRVIGELGFTDGDKAFDGDLNTFWADLGEGLSWVGLDFTTQVADIKCLQVVLAGVASLQPATAALQGWDGSSWATTLALDNPWTATLVMPLVQVSMMGWQQRPAPERSMWRLENTYAIAAWDVLELEFYSDITCSGKPLIGKAISSAVTATVKDPDGGHLLPSLAFDGSVVSMWSAVCPKLVWSVQYGANLGGCAAGQAWIGLNFGESLDVNCIRLMQSGLRSRQVSNVYLSSWGNAGIRGAKSDGWQQQEYYEGLAGDTWNLRPANPSVLWRVVYKKRNEQACSGENRPATARAWGVSELKFFADDDCKVPLPGPADGAVIIVSGTRAQSGMSKNGENPNKPTKAFDGRTTTYWSAECGTVDPLTNLTGCEPGYEFIGLDFTPVSGGRGVDVRCLDIYQSRATSKDCCDPASELGLERWNGTTFQPAIWRHIPRDKPPLLIEADMVNLGECKAYSATGSNFIFDRWEERGRRQAADCTIPLSGAVRLIADPLCEKHPKCVAAGFVGNCCPMDPMDAAFSRCCCDFLQPVAGNTPVFEDEIPVGIDREVVDDAPVVGIEYLIIRTTAVMPFVGVLFGVIFYFLIYFPRQRRPQDGRETMAHQFYMAFCAPIHRWLKPGMGKPIAACVAFFVVRRKNQQNTEVWLRRIIGLGICSYVFSCIIWIGIGWLVGQIVIKVILLCGVVVRLARSPFDPEDTSEERRRCIVLGLPFGETKKVAIVAPTPGYVILRCLQALVVGAIFSVRCLMDAVFMRLSAMTIGAVDVSLTFGTIVLHTPVLPFNIDLTGIMAFVEEFLSYSMVLFRDFLLYAFVGVPRCEGPVLIYASMCLIAITVVLIDWINCDYFGLFLGVNTCVAQSRPIFQQNAFKASISIAQTATFVVMQMMVLLFARSITLLNINPVTSTVNWNCPYDGDETSNFVGRIFMFLTSVVAILATFLCCNGHLMGKSALTANVAKVTGLSLQDLDRVPEGMVMRWDCMFSALPTICGIWIDGWNVKGFLIKERAHIYASQMKFPVKCTVCNEAHIPYIEVMNSSSKQISLALQIIPGGALVAKACEYFNDPPLFYRGTSLACFHSTETIDAAKKDMPRKMECSREAARYRLGYYMGWMKDKLLPLLVRVSSIGIYVSLIMFTFYVSKDNLADSVWAFFYTFVALSFLKAIVAIAIPVISVWILCMMLMATGRMLRRGHNPVGLRVRAMIGQVIHGVLCGVAFGMYLRKDPKLGTTSESIVMGGTAIGIVESFFVVFVCACLEKCPGSRLSGLLFVAVMSMGIAFGAAFALGSEYPIEVQLLITAFFMFIFIPISGFCFKPVKYFKDKPQEESGLSPLFKFPHFLSPFLGVIAGCFSGIWPYSAIIQQVGTYTTLGICVALGTAVGLGFSLATDAVVSKRAGQIAVAAGVAVALPIGILVHWALGAFVGIVIAAGIGIVLEMREIWAARKENFEVARFAEVAHSNLLDAKYALTGGKMQDVTLYASDVKFLDWKTRAVEDNYRGSDDCWKGCADTTPLPPPIEDETPMVGVKTSTSQGSKATSMIGGGGMGPTVGKDAIVYCAPIPNRRALLEKSLTRANHLEKGISRADVLAPSLQALVPLQLVEATPASQDHSNSASALAISEGQQSKDFSPFMGASATMVGQAQSSTMTSSHGTLRTAVGQMPDGTMTSMDRTLRPPVPNPPKKYTLAGARAKQSGTGRQIPPLGPRPS